MFKYKFSASFCFKTVFFFLFTTPQIAILVNPCDKWIQCSNGILFHLLFGFFDVGVKRSASQLRGFLELLLEIFTLFDMLAEFGVPFLNIIIVKTRRIRNGIQRFLRFLLALFIVIFALSPHGIKWVATLVWNSQGIDQR